MAVDKLTEQTLYWTERCLLCDGTRYSFGDKCPKYFGNKQDPNHRKMCLYSYVIDCDLEKMRILKDNPKEKICLTFGALEKILGNKEE